MRELKRGSIELANVPIIREFLETFPEELPGLPLVREIEVSIKMLVILEWINLEALEED
jgi:hypothetical protein